MTNSWGSENVLTSFGLPGSWKGTGQVFGAFKSESGRDEHFLLYDSGLADQKLTDVQK